MCGAWDIILCNAFLTHVHPSTSKSWTKEADHKGEKKKRNRCPHRHSYEKSTRGFEDFSHVAAESAEAKRCGRRRHSNQERNRDRDISSSLLREYKNHGSEIKQSFLTAVTRQDRNDERHAQICQCLQDYARETHRVWMDGAY
ncbi:Glutamate--tRNA ligase [Dissostichus eleginoides]|uniref:Glutamate--tRNA ligase n=1 Tax=Dissostichus eleginoides TaxID=100907 RepID=A0AAD9EX48_DISEL|nr:Glutamate--tRNA ligase [Dissostichus eleginoides]